MRSLAAFRVPCPAVPRTDDLAVLDGSFAKRATLVQAHIVHGAVSAVHVCDADGLIAAGEFFGGVGGGEFGLGGEFDEVRHGVRARARSRALLGWTADGDCPHMICFADS